jgi:hypothetical protein
MIRVMAMEERKHSDYLLRLQQHSDFLQVEVHASMNTQAVRIAFWQEIASEARERRMRKVLVVDRRKGVPATAADMAALVAMFRDQAGHFDRVAVIEHAPEFLPAAQHGEIHSQGHGINLRVFNVPADAERWLRYGSPDD